MTSLFHEVRFPVDISLGSTGGPERRTDVITLASGHEERNALWSASRRRYNAGYGVRSLDDIHRLIQFFEARNGRLYGFRFRDLTDWKSCLPSGVVSSGDQVLGAGDGEVAAFPLVKLYESGGASWRRRIVKPDHDSVKVEVAGAEKVRGTDYEVSDEGVIIFGEAAIPGLDEVVKAGYAFDVPVRFDSDYLAIDLAAFESGEVPEIALVEIRL